MFYTIYKVTNKINGKIYIGKHQTKDLNDGYMGSGKHLKRSIEKYGIDNFSKELLFVFNNEEDMNAKEAELVTQEFVKEDTNYNLCPGGHGGFGYINVNGLGVSENQKKAARKNAPKIAHLGGKASGKKQAEMKIGIFDPSRENGFKGKSHSQEWKEKHSNIMKEKQSGVKNSQYGTIWITDGKNNRKVKKDLPLPEGWGRGRITQ